MKKLFGKQKYGKGLGSLPREIVVQEVSNFNRTHQLSCLYASYRNIIYPHRFINRTQLIHLTCNLQTPTPKPFQDPLARRNDGKPSTTPSCASNIIQPRPRLALHPLHHFPLVPHPLYQAPTPLALHRHSAYQPILLHKPRKRIWPEIATHNNPYNTKRLARNPRPAPRWPWAS